MKQLLLGLLLSLVVSAAHAACPAHLQLQDASGVTAPARYSDDGSGNCMPNVVPALAGNAANGLTPKLLNALTNSAVSVKGSSGQLFVLQCGNTNTNEEYVQIFNIAAASVILGTSTPLLSIPIAPSATGGFALAVYGMQFSTAISVAATTTATGASAPSTALDCNAAFN